MSYEIRDALPADLPGILDIYNDAVRNTTAIWNETPVDLANRQAWFEARAQQGYPILVAVDETGCWAMPRLATGGRSRAFA
jgi:phosphinothricin acetyltransferase